MPTTPSQDKSAEQLNEQFKPGTRVVALTDEYYGWDETDLVLIPAGTFGTVQPVQDNDDGALYPIDEGDLHIAFDDFGSGFEVNPDYLDVITR